MRPKHLYLALALAGTVLPYSQFLPFLREHGLDLRLFLDQLFVNRISGFFAWDVIVSSLGLPLFLYMREGRLEGSA